MGEDLRADLGMMPDSVVAKKHGLSTRRVCTLRHKAGIPAFNGYLMFQEGSPCRSVIEAKYDAYLHWKGVNHSHSVRVGDLPFVADFLVENHLYVEITGMRGYEPYERKLERKKIEYASVGVACLFLNAEDVERAFVGCPLELKISPNRICTQCGEKSRRMANGLCHVCARRKWGHENGSECICEGCGETFIFPAGSTGSGRFCGYGCYWKSLEFDWPSWEWIDEQLATKSIRQLAAELDVKYTSLYMRIRRRKERAEAA